MNNRKIGEYIYMDLCPMHASPGIRHELIDRTRGWGVVCIENGICSVLIILKLYVCALENERTYRPAYNIQVDSCFTYFESDQ